MFQNHMFRNIFNLFWERQTTFYLSPPGSLYSHCTQTVCLADSCWPSPGLVVLDTKAHVPSACPCPLTVFRPLEEGATAR